MSYSPKWSEEETEYLLQIIDMHPEQTNFIYADMLQAKFHRAFTFDSVRKRRKRIADGLQDVEVKPIEKVYVEKHVINNDGSRISDKLIAMSDNDSKSVDFLLKAHGFDINEWELVKVENNIWNTNNKLRGIETLYSSRLSVKPKINGINWGELLETIKETKPIAVKLEKLDITEKHLLEIPLFDAHFGISDFEYYKPTQSKIYELLSSKHWEEVLFIVGQDMLHVDNFRGQTANGTQIEQINFVKAWNDCRTFYELLIEKAIKQSRYVKIMYAKGNHDESMSWAFVQMMKEKYPQVFVDDEIKERKIHSFNSVFIGVTHGDKARKNLHNIFPIEFPMEWARAKVKEIHTGHLHVQEDKDIFGMMVRTLATRNKTDDWHKTNGFVGAHKRFMLFEYSEEELERIHYV